MGSIVSGLFITHYFRSDDCYPHMYEGTYCQCHGEVVKPTRKMLWVLIDEASGSCQVCLEEPQHLTNMSKLNANTVQRSVSYTADDDTRCDNDLNTGMETYI